MAEQELPPTDQLTVCEEHDEPLEDVQVLPLVFTLPFEHVTVVEPVVDPEESVIVSTSPVGPPP